MAPLFVALMHMVLVTGVVLMAQGNKAGTLLEIHKVSFIAGVVLFAVHLLVYVPRAVRLSLENWRPARHAVPGAGLRSLLVIATIVGGVAFAIVLLPSIEQWHP